MPDASKAAREAATEICLSCGAWTQGTAPDVTVKLMSSIINRHLQAERDAAEVVEKAARAVLATGLLPMCDEGIELEHALTAYSAARGGD